jgi:hypothetical protein
MSLAKHRLKNLDESYWYGDLLLTYVFLTPLLLTLTFITLHWVHYTDNLTN